jgi:hypothetical protein
MRPGAVDEYIAGARVATRHARALDDPKYHHARLNARDKADRGLLEGRLLLLEVSDHVVRARWRGEGHLHRLGWAAGHWHCTCDARTDACSHLLALKRVIAIRSSEER